MHSATVSRIEFLGRQLAPVIRALWRRVGGTLPSDVRGDCEAEALVALWQARDRLESLPEAERPAYAAVCVRNVLRKFLQRELRHRSGAGTLEELREGTQPFEGVDSGAAEWGALIHDTLFQQVSHDGLVEALRALPSRDYAILDLFYARGLEDAEIARRVNLSPAAVKRRRSRAIAALREALRSTLGSAHDRGTGPSRA
jgi:RNA polymerase sigma factor (sigma-70 family)